MPLSDALSFRGSVFGRRVQERRGLQIYFTGGFRGVKPLFHIRSPFPLPRGRGIKGDGVNKQLHYLTFGHSVVELRQHAAFWHIWHTGSL